MSESGVDLQAAHEHFSASCFNAAWDLIDKPNRSAVGDGVCLALVQAGGLY
jgi:hypothetical protein